jgi:hypothetical protein
MNTNYDNKQEVEFPDQERLGQLIAEIGIRLEEVKGMLNPSVDSWPLASGRVGVIFVPSIPPSTACVLEHPDTGHWMLQYPCGGIFIGDLTTGKAPA